MAGPGGPTGPDPAPDPGPDTVPPAVLRAWDEAEARLFPLVMSQPELYQQALAAVQRLLGYLRETCPDLPSLLAAHGQGGELDQDPVPGVRPALIAAAACATRYREIAAADAARHRLAALARAREQDQAWTIVEETGQLERVPYVPYQRVEAEARTGRALIVWIGPDETFSRAVYRLDEGQVDLDSGAVRAGDPVGTYADAGELAAAVSRAQAEPG
jgi:hypothetical protein